MLLPEQTTGLSCKRKRKCSTPRQEDAPPPTGNQHWKSSVAKIQAKITQHRARLQELYTIDYDKRKEHAAHVNKLNVEYAAQIDMLRAEHTAHADVLNNTCQEDIKERQKPIMELENQVKKLTREQNKYKLLLKNPLVASLFQNLGSLDVIDVIEQYCSEFLCSKCCRFVPRSFDMCMHATGPRADFFASRRI